MPAPTPTIINGSNGVATIQINALDYQCTMGNWRASLNKQYFSQETFCSGPWVSEQAGKMQLIGSSAGYLSHGTAYSDPLVDFTSTVGVAVVLLADTGCQISFTGHIEKDMGVNAGANSEFGIRFRSRGVIATTWNVLT